MSLKERVPFKPNPNNPLICPICGNYTYIFFEGVSMEDTNKGIGIKVPIYKCLNCDKKRSILPKDFFESIKRKVLPSIKEGKYVSYKIGDFYPSLKKKKFKKFKHIDLKYDSRDYYIIPGLYREWDDGGLTPVFFKKEVLLHYNNHPDYSVRLASYSTGNIYYKGKRLLSWGFGINRNGKIFKWLCDVNDELSSKKMKEHFLRFKASNVSSDHDVVSKYYFSQIEVSFEESDNEIRLFELKNEFDESASKIIQGKLSKIDLESLDSYKHPILNERQQIFEAYLQLDKYMIEGLQNSVMKNYLTKNGIVEKQMKSADGRKFGSLKLLDLCLKILVDKKYKSDIVSPLFVLHDLRSLHGHLSDSSFETRYNDCKSRLSIPLDSNDFEVYMALISNLIESYKHLNSAL